MKFRKIFVTIIVLSVCFCCKRNFSQVFFSRTDTKKVIESVPYYIDPAGWDFASTSDFTSVNEFDNKYLLFFVKEDTDTVKYLRIWTNENKEALSIHSYLKEYNSQSKRFYLEMDSNDTLYLYSQTKDGEKKFYFGEYYYKFTKGMLAKEEMDFYLLHRDSLNKVRGNNLSPISK